ncbi:hypothetical protein [Ohessyouella blattaphilus]|uniref:hypothetical protein n=1 Tax=Ohessyouella blattaphilus TaxID=2949333 RepID=UPI003EBF6FEA
MKKIRIVVITFAVIVLAFIYSHIDKKDYIYDTDIDSSKYTSTGVIDENVIKQIFYSSEESIEGFGLKMSVSGDVSDVEILYKILRDDKVIRTGTLLAKDVDNNKFNYVEIDKIESTRDNEFAIQFEQKGGDLYNGVMFYLTPGIEENTELLIGESELNGTLTLRMVSHRFDVETFIISLIFVTYIVGFFLLLIKLFK